MVDYAGNWGIKAHSHNFYQMYYVTSGEGDLEIDGTSVRMYPDNCIIIHPHLSHQWRR
jgi:mannose-6-phosphate isomerase-like protein (cupin superfamily)